MKLVSRTRTLQALDLIDQASMEMRLIVVDALFAETPSKQEVLVTHLEEMVSKLERALTKLPPR